MGKTNLLDAIYYLCMTKSNFGQGHQQLVQHEADFFRLEGIFQLNEKEEKIVAKVIPRKTKQFERNTIPYKKLMEHIGLLPVVMIIPDDTQLVTGGSEERRRFMDNTLSQLDQEYLRQLLVYNKNLRQRNAALKQFGKSGHFDQALLDAYDAQMIEPAELLYEKRRAFITQFVQVFEQLYITISQAQEAATLVYQSHLKERNYKECVNMALQKDCILQRSTVGIHKDDLQFRLGSFPVKRFASQGQLKSFVLALKLAQFEFLRQQKGKAPILLLDDIFDKLDRQRVGQLVHLLMEQNFGQVCITDTHEHRLAEIVQHYDADYRQFFVDSGQAFFKSDN